MKSELPEKCYRVAAKAIIQDDLGRILLVRERGETWDLPGGGIEHEELSPVQTLRREIDEELGVAVVRIDERPLFVWKLIHSKSNKAILMQVGYRIVLASHIFLDRPDIEETRFVDAQSIKGLRFDAPNMADYLLDFLEASA